MGSVLTAVLLLPCYHYRNFLITPLYLFVCASKVYYFYYCHSDTGLCHKFRQLIIGCGVEVNSEVMFEPDRVTPRPVFLMSFVFLV